MVCKLDTKRILMLVNVLFSSFFDHLNINVWFNEQCSIRRDSVGVFALIIIDAYLFKCVTITF